ncbi:hypothetical protein GLOIN_2v149057 [Rhizophagus irregularis DAOM 181602=DAOM 197198]|nr:hypothetical protein GLOIN_2v149057 [Rhizophagus irregularis DAOM 181602=DAOM 197198]
MVFENIVQSIHKAINAIGFPIIKQNTHQYTYSFSIRILENDYYYINSLIMKLENYFKPKIYISNNIFPSTKFWDGPKSLNRLKRIVSNLDLPNLSINPQDVIWPKFIIASYYSPILDILTKIKTYIHNSLNLQISQF